jgi:aprataxin
MPREKKHSHISRLAREDVPMLEEMQCLSESFLKEHSHNRNDFQIGFHSVPSMDQLHLHLISRDFISPCLKTKKHWISFTSDFFRPLDDVIQSVRNVGSVPIDEAMEESKLKGKLVCHKCQAILANMPKLKDHILSHQ